MTEGRANPRRLLDPAALQSRDLGSRRRFIETPYKESAAHQPALQFYILNRGPR